MDLETNYGNLSIEWSKTPIVMTINYRKIGVNGV